jgi:hypothetical protein
MSFAASTRVSVADTVAGGSRSPRFPVPCHAVEAACKRAPLRQRGMDVSLQFGDTVVPGDPL